MDRLDHPRHSAVGAADWPYEIPLGIERLLEFGDEPDGLRDPALACLSTERCSNILNVRRQVFE